MTFCGFGGVFSFAAIAGRVINPAASADAVNVRALRRVRRSPQAFWQISHMFSPVQWLATTILVGSSCEVNLEGRRKLSEK
jgi:hypothetical protein